MSQNITNYKYYISAFVPTRKASKLKEVKLVLRPYNSNKIQSCSIADCQKPAPGSQFTPQVSGALSITPPGVGTPSRS